ncbi:MAG: PrpR N-terminal domain-containing protein [Clostridiales bacterium]|nr:PrpR N-terminal domain-containing protein [Clostridiales bacterium]
MAKLGLILPYQDIMDIAENIVEEQNLDIAYKKVVSTVEAVNEARNAVEAGAEIIVCRGYQAMLIKERTNIAMVEMRFHVQEIELLLMKAKTMLKQDCPRIGLIVFQNMLCDMSHVEELSGVKLCVAQINSIDETLYKITELREQGAELFIGGKTVCDAATNMGYPALLYRSSDESVREALREANRMAYAMEIEKKSQAQFETVLDTTFNGIIKINAQGTITAVNKQVEDLIGKNLEDVVGLPVNEVFPDFEEKMIQDILNGKSDSYTVSVNLRRQAWILLMAPIMYNESISGAILTLQKLSESVRRQSGVQRDMYLSGYTAKSEFSDFQVENAEMCAQLEMARKYAISDSPVLIYGEAGTEYYSLAESIHNNSSRKNGAFVSVNLGVIRPDDQMKAIFGESEDGGETEQSIRRKAAAVQANNGTLFIQSIECMTPQLQYRLSQVLFAGTITKTETGTLNELNARLIIFSGKILINLVEKCIFSSELLYQIQGLVIELPPLRQRPEDVKLYFHSYFEEYKKKYSKYLVPTKGVEDRILKLNWDGNLLQLRSFCERLVITADKRSVNEVLVQKIYDSLYPRITSQDGVDQVIVYRTPEADEINNLMAKYHGSRQMVAKEMGISTTTLWRRMKKYGIEAKYH